MIEIRQLQVTFNPGTPLENPALRGIDLDIPAGQFL
ncbi:MAG: putative tryptophan/tyrosine transport system ATP-binding protein, partial [Pseudomonadota bacterium]|nr:putative tryptophan/tyrosine transport system ATP-binding protein [Pseudomonadota bacterium]